MTVSVTQDETRLSRATSSLIGLSVGDAFGETFFHDITEPHGRLADRTLSPPPWPYTDDTEMALSIVAILRRHQAIDQDALAREFARRYDSRRGYGSAMHALLPWIGAGHDWGVGARALFGGAGSFGNGAAMRVAPLGAYFSDDLAAVVREAERSAVVTHTHPEGVSGAIAVACATAVAATLRGSTRVPDRPTFIDMVVQLVPESEVRRGLVHARDLRPGTGGRGAGLALGNGSRVSAQDTAPFAIWCAAERVSSYEEALWLAASGAADVDTVCAIVGGIVAARTGEESIPLAWRQAREPLPRWPFGDDASG